MKGASIYATLGWILGIISVAEVFTALLASRYQDPATAIAFAGASLVCSFVAIGLIFGFRDVQVQLRRRHGLTLVVMVWLGVPVFAAMPFLAISPSGGVLAAYFEAISAFTTTGATLAPAIDELPRGVIFWRALLSWFGGAATIVFAAAALDRMRWETGEGLLIFSAGLADPVRLLAASREFLPLYTVLTAICCVGLIITGVPRFDAVCLALSALSTGGIMPRDGEFASYGSIGATYVMTLFMVAGGAVFVVVKLIKSRSDLAKSVNADAIYGAATIALATLGIVLSIAAAKGGATPYETAGAAFSIVSLVTTSGILFDDQLMPHIPMPAIFVFIMVGGIYGSTSGGLKIGRVIHMLRDSGRELDRLIHPSAIVKLSDRDGRAESGRIVWTYFFAYMIVFACLAAITAYSGADFEHAMFWSAAMVSNVGPVLDFLPGTSGNPIAILSEPGAELLLLASAATMVLGRIEVLALLAILTPTFWRR